MSSYRGAATSAQRRRAAENLRTEAKTRAPAWARVTGGTRLCLPRTLRRPGERLVVGLATSQHELVTAALAKAEPAPNSSHAFCPHCLAAGLPPEISIRTPLHVLLHCPVTGSLPDTTDEGALVKEARAVLQDPLRLIKALCANGDIPGQPSDYIRTPAPD